MSSPFQGAPPISGFRAWLVYFRANRKTGTFPAQPVDLMGNPSNPECLVIADLTEGRMQEHLVLDPLTLDLAVANLFKPEFYVGQVYTVHGNSVLGRLVRWHGIKFNKTVPAGLQPRYIGDIVERINAPAILTGSWRYNFRTSDYVELLGINPDSRFDKETGTLADMINRYGNN